MRLELTKRADYAIRSVLALARSGEDARLSTREIAEAHGVPERFLGQVMRDLVAAGLVEGTVGRTGGYRLAKPSSARESEYPEPRATYLAAASAWPTLGSNRSAPWAA